MVSPWMQEDLLQHLNKYPGVNRVAIVRDLVVHASGFTEFYAQDDWSCRGTFLSPRQRRRSRGFERGLSRRIRESHSLTVMYLQMNILFGNAGIPQICDFSLITFYSPVPKNDLAPESCGLRWVAPEILGGSNDKSGHPTRMSDIYAFGMVVVEVRCHYRFYWPTFYPSTPIDFYRENTLPRPYRSNCLFGGDEG